MREALTPSILVVDDDRSNLDSIERVFAREGFRVRTAGDGLAALDLIRAERPDVLVSDLMMPGLDGASLLRTVKAMAPEVEVVLMTAYGTVETAVAAMKDGAYDFITKPLKRHSVLRSVRKALEKRALVQENRELRTKLAELSAPAGMIGQSRLFRATLDTVRQAAASHATVLITGESGTGKELVARALHELSTRHAGPFVPVNCAALPESILESELFGYERGAFTGANSRKEGRFDRADKGTLLLDEVAEMSPSVQAKLLRVVQQGEFERLGGVAPVKVDVRLVAATNRDLISEVRAGRFREDLYYRLNVVAIPLPPLRDRPEDIPLLADHFLHRFSRRNEKGFSQMTPEALAAMSAYSWPGNVRELENIIERAVVLGRGPQLTLEDLPVAIRSASGFAPAGAELGGAPSAGSTGTGAGDKPLGGMLPVPLGTPLEEVERMLIRETLRYTHGDKTLAARLLGIAPRTIYRKMDRETE